MKITRTLIAFLILVFAEKMNAQPWSYDFGTGTGTHTSSTASTSFLPTPTSGTSRVRVGTKPGSIVMANAGLSALGTSTELQITSNTSSSSTTQFSVYDYTAAKTGYVKFKIAFSGGTNGVYRFWLGDGATLSDNNAKPIAGYGPFVMNTKDEIREAIDDFNSGRFEAAATT